MAGDVYGRQCFSFSIREITAAGSAVTAAGSAEASAVTMAAAGAAAVFPAAEAAEDNKAVNQ